MTKRMYLAVGHGIRPDGRFDPGAIGLKGEREHDFNHLIARMVANYLKDAVGLEVTLEENDGDHEDPNFVGSIQRVNAGNFDFAVSIHFDWNQAPRGGFGLYYSDAGRRIADTIATQYARQKLPLRPNARRTDLSFIKQTKCPAIIWETDRIGAMTSDELVKAATAIGDGLLAVAGARLPAPPEPPPPATPDTPTQGLVKRLYQDIAGREADSAGLKHWTRLIEKDPVYWTPRLIGGLTLELRRRLGDT